MVEEAQGAKRSLLYDVTALGDLLQCLLPASEYRQYMMY